MPKVTRVFPRLVSFERHFANHSNVQNSRHIEGKLQITAYYKTDAAMITAK